MKKIIQSIGIFAIALTMVFTSCPKEDNNDISQDIATPKTTTQYLTAGAWKITALTGIIVDGGIEIDLFAENDNCSKDDLITWNTDGTITNDQGADNCEPSDPQTTTGGSWTLSTDNKILTFHYPDEAAITLTIIEINDTTFKGTFTQEVELEEGTETYNVTITMTKA